MTQHKTFDLIEVKADGHSGTFTALASVFHNVDSVGDRVMPGAFSKTLANWRESGDPIPVILSHKWDDPMAMIGKADPHDVIQTPRGLQVTGNLDVTGNPIAKQVHKLMKERLLKGWSFGYTVPDGGEQAAEDGANELTEIDLIEVGPTLKGANPEAELQAIKSLAQAVEVEQDVKLKLPEPAEAGYPPVFKAVWTTSYINDLPDSAFLYVEPGGSKDSDGKTVPRSMRHFPVKDASGSVDLPHVRNALSRIPQSNLPQSVKDRATAAAKRLLGSSQSSSVDQNEVKEWPGDYTAGLPDASFLFIEPGGEKDSEGKTIPNEYRHFPVRDLDGTLNVLHLQKALEDLPQFDLPQSIKDRLKATAESLLQTAVGEDSGPEVDDATRDEPTEAKHRAQDPLRRQVSRERLRLALGK